MTKVNIKQVETFKNGNPKTLGTSDEVEIEALRPRQFGAVMKIINQTQKDLQSNENFKATVQNFFNDYSEGFDMKDLMRDESFNIFSILDAVSFLLEETPERLMELVSTMTGIERVLIENQDMDTFFDIVEAIIEVNDIERLIERIKRVSSQVGKAMNFVRAKQEGNQQQPKAVNS